MFEDFTSYNILKWTHILSAFLLFGTGLGSAFYKWMSDRSGNIEAQAITAKHVVLADFLFTTPSAIYQPISGFLLLQQLGTPLSEPWVVLSFVLYIIAGLCWLPVVWLQILMRDLALDALDKGQGLSQEYRRLARIWFWLGWPAFVSLIVAVWLMVAKPDLPPFWS
ncbi:MAG: DUF2269 domain-containing protein [Hyphomicrobiaceae bacterium]|nr:DUF2269 domain-containing protein [Hyphomicrobiaceae bacterium]